VFDQRADAVVTEFVTECFRVVSFVGSEAPQVARVAADSGSSPFD